MPEIKQIILIGKNNSNGIFAMVKICLQGLCRPSVYLINQLHLGSLYTVASCEYGFVFAEIFDYQIADLKVSDVNDTTHHLSSITNFFVQKFAKLSYWWAVSLTPPI
jgi:hypothetical protein